MKTFFPDLLDRFLLPEFLEGVRQKFHYGDTQADEFYAVAKEMLPFMRKEACWESKKFLRKDFYQSEISDALYEQVVMSLGKGIDCLQEQYSKKDMLSQSYMIEVLASELLMQGYDAYNRYIKETTDRHVARYHFPGSEEAFPLEMLPQLLEELTGQITCTSAFCMSPKKSVAFIAELTRDESMQCKGICVGCNNARCPNRVEENGISHRRIAVMADMPLTYGYSRIFGRI